MAEYRVVEKFVSINGEGTHAGQLAVFIRFKGCNLRCSYCDTMWANEPDAPFTVMTEEDIYNYIMSTGVKNVTLTGGEPLIQPDINILLKKLAADQNIRVEIETNGSADISPIASMENRPSLTLDYKLGGSGMEQYMLTKNYNYIGKNDTVKFVVSSRDDLITAKNVIDTYGLTEKCSVYFSPVFGRIDPADIVDFMIQNKMNGVNMQLQMHKFIWDPNKRGV
ncbi:MAG: putative 7-carboxy-7-deazaguanine synthase QueE [Oscillospiraceae bacterium]